MNYLYKYTRQKGYVPIVNPENSELSLIEFGLLWLEDREAFSEHTGDKEVVLVILGGKCAVRCGDVEWSSIGAREIVFGGKAYGVYLPCQTSYEIVSQGKVEIALCKAPADKKTEPKLVVPEEVVSKSVGQWNWRRDVQSIIGADVNAQRLLVGETFNPPGNWSSYPPHKHDEEREDEVKLEEVYHFRLEPPEGFGLQRIYTKEGTDEAYVVRNCDTMVIPKGYHPVVAAPGYRLYYLWVLAGEKRLMKPKDDPKHSWVKNIEPVLGEARE